MIKTMLIEKPEFLIKKPDFLKLFSPISDGYNFYFSFKYSNRDIDILLIEIEEFFYGKNKTFLSAKFSKNPDYNGRINKFLNLYFYSKEDFDFNIICHNGHEKRCMKDNILFSSKEFEVIILEDNNVFIKILTDHFNIDSYLTK